MSEVHFWSKNIILNKISKWSSFQKFLGFVVAFLLIVPLYGAFVLYNGKISIWIQAVVLGAYVIIAMNYFLCVVILAFHRIITKKDHIICNVFFVVITLLVISIGVTSLQKSGDGMLESYHQIANSPSPNGQYSIVIYGERKDVFSGYNAEVYLVKNDSNPSQKWLVCELVNQREIRFGWKENDLYINSVRYSIEEIKNSIISDSYENEIDNK